MEVISLLDHLGVFRLRLLLLVQGARLPVGNYQHLFFPNAAGLTVEVVPLTLLDINCLGRLMRILFSRNNELQNQYFVVVKFQEEQSTKFGVIYDLILAFSLLSFLQTFEEHFATELGLKQFTQFQREKLNKILGILMHLNIDLTLFLGQQNKIILVSLYELQGNSSDQEPKRQDLVHSFFIVDLYPCLLIAYNDAVFVFVAEVFEEGGHAEVGVEVFMLPLTVDRVDISKFIREVVTLSLVKDQAVYLLVEKNCRKRLNFLVVLQEGLRIKERYRFEVRCCKDMAGLLATDGILLGLEGQYPELIEICLINCQPR